MPDYKKMYHIMFNAATNAERLACEASEILRQAQQECEKLYVDAPEMPIKLHMKTENEIPKSNAAKR